MQLPSEFLNKYQSILSHDDYEQFVKSFDEPAKKAFRINKLANQTVPYDLSKPVPIIGNAYYGQISGHDSAWTGGYVYSQDPAAMFPAYLLDAQPGEKILDLCAAPGGKSTAILENLANEGVLVSNEINPGRAKILKENIERWGVKNSLITCASPAKLVKYFTGFFDKIIVDAPCSGEGMFRKDHDAIQYWSQDYVLECQTRQKEILESAIKMLKSGGKLVYATCTFSPEEDEEIVEWLTTKDFSIDKKELDHPKIKPGIGSSELEKTFRFWPGLGEGQFAAHLTFHGENSAKKLKPLKAKKLGKDATLVKKALVNYPELDLSDAVIRNDHVFIPALANDLTGIKILNNGLDLGILKKNRFEPSHQLALYLGKKANVLAIELNEDEYNHYLHGETVRVKSDLSGFILVSHQGLIFSFGKIVNGQIKNFYPKGLRQ
ncbi:MAG: RsmF rRNA methyltransferase first C-terminal domain-containing protein [Lactobacillus sp.]|nr:RsmF rRNA methyltransferase first C-terminal domain-containing protein [Lactobacillus sp.]